MVVLPIGTLIFCNRVPEEERGLGMWLLVCFFTIGPGIFGTIRGFSLTQHRVD